MDEMDKGRFTKWATAAEKSFLDEIGTFYHGRERSVNFEEDKYRTRKRLLLNYRNSMADRMDWGLINPIEIQAYVDRLLEAMGY